MKIIRDQSGLGMFMIPLFVDWNVRRCNVEGCTARPTTIVSQLADDVPLCGFCEEHYLEAKKPGGTNFTLVFDDYDAFKSGDEQCQLN